MSEPRRLGGRPPQGRGEVLRCAAPAEFFLLHLGHLTNAGPGPAGSAPPDRQTDSPIKSCFPTSPANERAVPGEERAAAGRTSRAGISSDELPPVQRPHSSAFFPARRGCCHPLGPPCLRRGVVYAGRRRLLGRTEGEQDLGEAACERKGRTRTPIAIEFLNALVRAMGSRCY